MYQTIKRQFCNFSEFVMISFLIFHPSSSRWLWLVLSCSPFLSSLLATLSSFSCGLYSFWGGVYHGSGFLFWVFYFHIIFYRFCSSCSCFVLSVIVRYFLFLLWALFVRWDFSAEFSRIFFQRQNHIFEIFFFDSNGQFLTQCNKVNSISTISIFY